MIKEVLKTFIIVLVLVFSIIYLNNYNAKYDTKTLGIILAQKDVIGHGEAINYITLSYLDSSGNKCNCVAHSPKMFSYVNGQIVDLKYVNDLKSECLIVNKYVDPGVSYILILIICFIILRFIYNFISYGIDG